MNAKYKLRKKFQSASIGAAMADTALLLLIFFVATSTTEPPSGVEANIPLAQTEAADQDSIYISISQKGEYYIDQGRASLEEIRDSLLMRQSEKNKIIAITADKDLNYGVIKKLLEILQKTDFLNIVFMAQEKRDK